MKFENFTVGYVQEGHILGLEEAVLPPHTQPYSKTAICHSMHAELYRIDKQSFINKLQPQVNHWADLCRKATAGVKRTQATIKNKASIPAKLRRKPNLPEEVNAGSPNLENTS